MINILIVEDDINQRKKLINILKNIDTNFKVYEASTGKQAINIFNELVIDLFFIDIQLPDISGLKIAEIIRSIQIYELTHMVIITTHVYFQLEAFKKFHCYDFIEKPYKSEDILNITNRLINGINTSKEKEEEDAVCFELKNCVIKILIKEILFIESQKRNCIVHTTHNAYQVPNMTMKQVAKLFNTLNNIMKTHKSYIINIKNIYKIDKTTKNSWVVYFDNYDIPAFVSNSYKDKLLDEIYKNESVIK